MPLILNVAKRPLYCEEGEVLQLFETRKFPIRELHIFTDEYFDQFQTPEGVYDDRWLKLIVGVFC